MSAPDVFSFSSSLSNKRPNDPDGRETSQEARNETAELLAKAEQMAHLGSWQIDFTTGRVIWSKELFHIFGLQSQPYGLSVEDYRKMIHPDDADLMDKTMTELNASGNLNDKVSLDYRVILNDGSIRILHSERVVKEVTKDGKPKIIVGIEQDVTESRKAQEELYKNRELLDNIINTSTSIIVARDLNGKLILLNNTLANHYKLPKDEALGTTLYDVYPKEVADEISAWDQKVLAEGMAIAYEEVVPINGNLHTFASNKFPLRDANGKIYGVGAIITDITSRKQMELKLDQYSKNLEKIVNERTKQIRQNEQSYRELYESFDEAFIAVDWELNVIHWNKAAERITAIAAEDALGKKVYKVLPEMITVNIEPYLETLQAKKPTRFMMNATSRQTGKPSIFEISAYPSTLGIIIIVEDKTEEEETKRLSTIGQVAGMVGHDLRNPLQSIVGEIYLAKNELGAMPDSEQKGCLQESVNAIAEQVSYMDKIVSDLQTFVKPVEVHKQSVNLKRLIVALLAQISIPKNVQTSMQVETSLNADTDPQLLKRVLINLVTNAVQAMPEGGELTLKAKTAKAGQVEIVVEDTGMGIPDEIMPKIFTPLFTTKSKGQGFGLAVCKRVIEAQGGSINFESKVGKGTKFTITLPK